MFYVPEEGLKKHRERETGLSTMVRLKGKEQERPYVINR